MTPWSQVPLGDVLTLHYGKALPKDDRNPAGDVPLYGANGIKEYSDQSLASGPSLIIGRKGSAGEINRVEGLFWPLDVTYFTEHDASRIDFNFLEYALRLMDLPSLAKGVKPGINRNEVYGLPLSLPPLQEQKRIVTMLDKAFAALDRARALGEANLADTFSLLEQASDSIISGKHRNEQNGSLSSELAKFSDEQQDRASDKKFRGPLVTSQGNFPELPQGWIWASPEQLCTHIVDCLHSTPKWSEKGKLCLRTTNFRPNHLDLNKKKYVSDKTYQKRIVRLEPMSGDVLYSREGGILGIACVLPDGIEACLGQRMMQFRLRSEIVLPDYFCSVLNSGLVLKEVRHCVSGAAAPHLNIGDIRRFPIPVPPIVIQRKLVCDVQALSACAQKLRWNYEQQLLDNEDFRQGLLQQAFAGELT